MFHLLILLVQINLQASEVEGRVGAQQIAYLVKTKSVKISLPRSPKKNNDVDEKGGHDYSNDDAVQVTKLPIFADFCQLMIFRVIDAKQHQSKSALLTYLLMVTIDLTDVTLSNDKKQNKQQKEQCKYNRNAKKCKVN